MRSRPTTPDRPSRERPAVKRTGSRLGAHPARRATAARRAPRARGRGIVGDCTRLTGRSRFGWLLTSASSVSAERGQPVRGRDDVVGAGQRPGESRQRVRRCRPPRPTMLSSIAARIRWSRLKPTKIVPCRPSVPYAMLRRKILPNSSWSVRATCEVGGRGSSSALSAFRRPMIASCAATGSASQAIASCSHCWSSRIEPPSPGEPGGTSATAVASTSVGFSVPSMKPVRSRSWWYGQPTISLASSATSASAVDDAARQVEHDVVGGAGQPDHDVVLRRRQRRIRRRRPSAR